MVQTMREGLQRIQAQRLRPCRRMSGKPDPSLPAGRQGTRGTPKFSWQL